MLAGITGFSILLSGSSLGRTVSSSLGVLCVAEMFQNGPDQNREYASPETVPLLASETSALVAFLSPKVFRLNQFEELVPVAFHNA